MRPRKLYEAVEKVIDGTSKLEITYDDLDANLAWLPRPIAAPIEVRLTTWRDDWSDDIADVDNGQEHAELLAIVADLTEALRTAGLPFMLDADETASDNELRNLIAAEARNNEWASEQLHGITMPTTSKALAALWAVVSGRAPRETYLATYRDTR